MPFSEDENFGKSYFLSAPYFISCAPFKRKKYLKLANNYVLCAP